MNPVSNKVRLQIALNTWTVDGAAEFRALCDVSLKSLVVQTCSEAPLLFYYI